MIKFLQSMILIWFLIWVSDCAASIDLKIAKVMPKGCKFRVTSGHRTKAQNKRVGGVPNSYHLKNRARDIVFWTLKCKHKFIKNILTSDLSVIKYPKSISNHVHVDDRSNKVCLVAFRINGKTKYRYCKGFKK